MKNDKGVVPDAASVASQLLVNADRDVAFVLRIIGDSRQRLFEHFYAFIEVELDRHGIVYDDHPLLRPFVETHAHELCEFVVNGVALRHQLGLHAFETLEGDPARLLRIDLWDSLRSLIEDGERQFLAGTRSFMAMLAKVEALRGTGASPGRSEDTGVRWRE